jgi:serine/threonine protein kinase
MTKQKVESFDSSKQNIIRDVIKFIDFGTTKPVNISEGTLLGTPIYMAPEILSQIFKSKGTKSEKYDFSCDIFSLGLTFAELWEGKMVEREDSNYLKIILNLTKHQDEEGFKVIVSMIEGCCQFIPSDRWKVGKIVETLSLLNQKHQ